METQENFHMEQGFVLLQEEINALVLIQRMPYRPENQDLSCKAALFCHLFEEQTGRKVEAKEIEEFLFGCLLETDYSPVDARLPECHRTIERLFQRARFNPDKDV